ncbi:hypothetical protein PVAND_001538 [Polypedilum vanderplanki]|uniref:Ionotropic receptor n=1 Tax=Polypedilum vanderplanki TaxID=319348 RepID=A0A9J6BNQ2_POLVA|nr:hypothetical protein PVAND_001538 [Polypedilum vanderplanki]
MFEFMTTDMRKPLPTSIEDLKEMNYTIVITPYEDISKRHEELIRGREKPKIMNLTTKESVELYEEVLNGKSTAKYAFFMEESDHSVLNSTFGRTLPRMKNEDIQKEKAFGTIKNGMLVEQLNHVVDCLQPTGIIKHIDEYSKWHVHRQLDIEPEDTKRILSMSDLEFGFVIFLGFLSLAIFVFICELHALYVRRQLRKLLGLYEFVRVIKERLKDYHDIYFVSLLFLLTLCHGSSSTSIESQNFHPKFSQSISKAISDVIHEFFIVQNIKFDFIVYGKKSNHINDIIDEVTKKVNEEIPTNLKYITNIQNWNHEFNRSAVIFIKSIKNLENFQSKSKTYRNDGPKLKYYGSERLKFLVYIEDMEYPKQFLNVLVYKRFEYISFIGELQFYEFFIYLNRKQKEVSLFMHKIYGAMKCENFELLQINSMNINTQEWFQTLKNFDHYENFYGCMIDFIVHYSFLFYYSDISKNEDPDERQFAGVMFEIIQIMSSKHSFTPHYIISILKDLHFYNIVTKNYQPNGQNAFLFSIAPVIFYDRFSYYTQSFSSTNFMFHISYNDLYTNYEKLTMPFDDLTWIFLLLTFGLTFATIFGLQFCPRWIRTIFFGKGINNPAYNALGIFYGISQLRLPRESFPRATLVIFIWFCLIIRTCWQSKMFELMTTDMKKPLPASIDDLVKMNYTVVVDELKFKYFKEILNGRESPQILNLTDLSVFFDLYKRALDGETKSKYAFFTNNFEEGNWKNNFSRSLPIIENEILSKPLAIASPLNNILQYSLNKLVDHLIPSGILNHLLKYGEWYVNRPIHVEPEDTRRILSMTDLEFGFVIFLGFMSLPIVVFICELHALYVRRQLRKLIGLYEFVRVLRKRLKDYHDKW